MNGNYGLAGQQYGALNQQHCHNCGNGSVVDHLKRRISTVRSDIVDANDAAGKIPGLEQELALLERMLEVHDAS